MKFLVQELLNNNKFKEIAESIKNETSPIAISGLSDVSKVNVIASILESTKRKICVLTYNEIQAKKLVKDLKYFFKKVYFFPKREIAPYDYIAESKDLPYERIAVLNKIKLQEKSREPIIVVTTIEAVMQKMISKEELYENIVDFKIGETYRVEDLKKTFVKLGYERTNLIEGQGQFSIRGGIVDVGLSNSVGVRIEFWGDEVDSIRYFKIDSQRSTEMIQNITIFPAHEFITQDVSKAINKIEENYSNAEEDIELIKNGEVISKIDKYFNEFYENYKEQYKIIKHQRDIARKDQVVSLEKYRLKQNSMQVGFITNLKKILEAGEDKALLISATGERGIFVTGGRNLGFTRASEAWS